MLRQPRSDARTWSAARWSSGYRWCRPPPSSPAPPTRSRPRHRRCANGSPHPARAATPHPDASIPLPPRNGRFWARPPRTRGAHSRVRRSRVRERRCVVDGEEEIVDVAVPPVLTWFVGLDEWVVLRTEMGGGVAVRRVVTAADVATGHAHPQVHPLTA